MFARLILTLVLFTAALPATASDRAPLYDLSFDSIEGTPLPLSQFQGQVILLVNTASYCGFTNQYAGLQKLYDQYRDQGLVVIGVPSNSFEQEPDSLDEVKFFCEANFGIEFPLTDKYAVAGGDAHPVYRLAREALGPGAAPRWNFHKYLIGRDGRFIRAFPSSTRPQSGTLTGPIEAALKEPAPKAGGSAD